MNEEQQKYCWALTVLPNGKRRISKEDFLRIFPSAVEHGRLAKKWLQEAYETHNADDLSCALLIGFNFGFVPEHREILRYLLNEDWHDSHEDIVSALDELSAAENVDALFRATQWIPKSLEYDDNRALAVKAIWALGKIPGPAADAKLKILARTNNEIIQKNAVMQLERRRAAT